MNAENFCCYPANVVEAISGFKKRRRWLLEAGGRYSVQIDAFGSHSLTMLALGSDTTKANATLRVCAEWFKNEPPKGMTLQGECDFVAQKLCRAWHQFGVDRLEPATERLIKNYFINHDFASLYQSENHAFLFHTSRFLMAQEWRGETFKAYKKTGEQLWKDDRLWLKRFLIFRASQGWAEFNSVCYLAPVWECLACLYDFASDANLRQLAGDMMTLLLTEMAVNSLEGMYGGAHGRIYENHALNHATEPCRILNYLYFNGEEPPISLLQHSFVIDVASCRYRPPPLVVDIALNRCHPYAIRERKHLHNLADVLPVAPLEGSIYKYSWWTPNYILGCVQQQDAYPDGDCCHHPHHEGMAVPEDQRLTQAYAHHQQHEWDLSFAAKPDARIFTHHPGLDGSHNYWTGDRQCGCGQFLQQRSAVVAVYDIPFDQPCAWIHAYLPRVAFDEVVERDGWLFILSGTSCAALALLPSYQWTTDGEWANREVVSNGHKHGVVCEAGILQDFGGFAAFQEEICGNRISFVPDLPALSYHSNRAGLLEIGPKAEKRVNGQPAEFSCSTYESPYLHSNWKSGLVRLSSPSGGLLLLDFLRDTESMT